MKNACPSWASAKKFNSPFAQLGQAPKKTIWHLPNLGKHRKKRFGICPTWASIEKNDLAFAQAEQAPKSQ